MSEFEKGGGNRGEDKLAGNRFDLLSDPCQKEGSRKNSLSQTRHAMLDEFVGLGGSCFSILCVWNTFST